MEVAAGALRAFYLYDIADTIDLRALRSVGGEGLAPAHLRLRPHTSPAYLEFPVPPLVARLSEETVGGRKVERRIKVFDYGVVSVRLSLPFSGGWHEFMEFANTVRNTGDLPQAANRTLEEVRRDIAHALDDPHEPLMEDYFIIEVEHFNPSIAGSALETEYENDLGSLILGESGNLSRSYLATALRERFVYFVDDLTIVQWDAAFIYDRRESAEAIGDILEFANSQLVELRTYDALLDRELDDIYAMQPGRPIRSPLGRRAAEQAGSLRYMIVDVLELHRSFEQRAEDYRRRLLRAHLSRSGKAARAGRLGASDRSQDRQRRGDLPLSERSGARRARTVSRNHRHRADRDRGSHRRSNAAALSALLAFGYRRDLFVIFPARAVVQESGRKRVARKGQ